MHYQDIEEIKKLKARYAYYVDGYYSDPPSLDRFINEVFSEDAAVDFGAFGSARGREEIRDWYLNVCFATLSFCLHMLNNPLIDLTGEGRAAGKWYFLVPCTWREGNNAVWLTGMYDETYEKVGERWYIKTLKANWVFGTSFDKGWTKENIIPS